MVKRYFNFILLSLILILGVDFANAQAGRRFIINGREKYFEEDFQNAIRDFESALEDPSLDYKDSVVSYFLLAFSYIKLGNLDRGLYYFRKILSRNLNEKLPEGFEEFEEYFEKIRREVNESLLCRLHIKTNPPGALVYLDGINKGETPITLSPLRKGQSYKVELKKSGYEFKALSIFVEKDTSLVFDLSPIQPTPYPPRVVYIQPSFRSYLFGLSTGVALGLASAFLSAYFDNETKKKIHTYSIEQDTNKIKKLKSEIRTSHCLGTIFYYASYPLIAIGFYAGLKISEGIFPRYYLLKDKKTNTEVYCSIDPNLKPIIKIRRSIW